jgi:exopolysaccharide biosynthesis WecB/TagA/CpsF family protein
MGASSLISAPAPSQRAAPPQAQGLGEPLVIGGVPCSRASRAEMVAAMLDDVRLARAGGWPARALAAANGLVVSLYHSDPAFRKMIAATDIVDVDGQPLVLATHLICRAPLRERVATTDLILDAAKVAAEQGLRFYFLGARPGVAAAAAEHLTARYPGLQIVGCRDGYFSQGEEEAICADVVAAGTDVLWLGLGSPLQDRFAARNRDRLAGLAWIRTCGGLFDYYSGDQPRAPWLMQVLGLEWLFRSLREPRRLGLRYLTTNPRAVPYHHQNARLRRPFSRGQLPGPVLIHTPLVCR